MLKDVKGVGPKTLGLLNKLGIFTIDDLLDYYPFKYNSIAPTELRKGNVVICGIVETMPVTTYIKRNLNKLTFRIEACDQLVGVTIFNRPFMKNNLRRGMTITVLGEYDEKRNMITASNIMFKELHEEYIEPVYHVTSGITSKLIGNLVKNAFEIQRHSKDFIPEYLVTKYDFKDKDECIGLVHNPDDLNELEEIQNRLKYEELFKFMFKINFLKSCRTDTDGLPRNIDENVVEEFINSLKFELTSDQQKAIRDIAYDLLSPKRMNRLLLGDVGSGKTVVAVASCYLNILSGYQSALLVPTEILATQHYLNITELLSPFGMRVEILKGKTPKKERDKIIEDLKNGDIDLLVGTHAVLSEDVVFKNLGLVITDEQHRFGVSQRNTFQNKGKLSDVLYMSATPIPRTYALTIYGDMDISTIKTKPAGRKEVVTTLESPKNIKKVLESMLEELKSGHQVYVVCPLIEAEEDSKMMDVITLKASLEKAFQGKIPIGMLHGHMKPAEKEKAMDDFKNGVTRVIVSTTVIEVGVDVPNATMMIIFNAERFGLASMHQLRGRIGRNSLASKCILLSDKSAERLKVLVDSTDGFYISEEDFKMRGEGDLFGTRQSGDMVFKLANLKTDMRLLTMANVDSDEFIKSNKDNDFKDYPEYKKLVEELSHID